jgi:hypothetical protein
MPPSRALVWLTLSFLGMNPPLFKLDPSCGGPPPPLSLSLSLNLIALEPTAHHDSKFFF